MNVTRFTDFTPRQQFRAFEHAFKAADTSRDRDPCLDSIADELDVHPRLLESAIIDVNQTVEREDPEAGLRALASVVGVDFDKADQAFGEYLAEVAGHVDPSQHSGSVT